MSYGCSMFSQIMKLVPNGLFDEAVRRHQGPMRPSASQAAESCSGRTAISRSADGFRVKPGCGGVQPGPAP